MDTGPAGRRSAVEAALLDYQRTPGKFALLKREPAVLFASIKDVLQIAAGRPADGGEAHAPSPELRQAACFFMRGAMLQQSADHYMLLGVDRKATTDVIKDRYRLMMRLMHPDFALQEGGTIWPADTASRVNRAYETLSSPESRQQYDAGLAPPAALGTSGVGHSLAASQAMRAVAEAPAPVDPRSRLKVIAAVMGALGVVLLGSFLLGSPDRESLVQRQDEPADIVARANERTATSSFQRPAEIARADAATTTSPARDESPRDESSRDGSPREQPAPDRPAPALGVHVADSVSTPLPPVVAQLDQAKPFFTVIQRAARPSTPTTPANLSPTLKLSTAVSSLPATRVSAAMPMSAPQPAMQIAAAPLSVAPAEMLPAAAVAALNRPNPGVTMAEIHPMLAALVQQVESGTGDRLLTMLDRDARRAPSAVALVRQYNSMVDGGTVKVSHVQFRTEPQDGRLVVTGYLIMEVASPNSSPAGKELILQAEFVSHNGAAVMTGLSRAQAPARAR